MEASERVERRMSHLNAGSMAPPDKVTLAGPRGLGEVDEAMADLDSGPSTCASLMDGAEGPPGKVDTALAAEGPFHTLPCII